MSDDFAKIYGSILDSSIWREPGDTRLLWITMLAMADGDGFVEASVGGLADRARISRESCVVGLETLRSPDPDSKIKDFEGRRIRDVEGGWVILNHRRYRDRRSKKQKQTAERVAAWRARQAKRGEAEEKEPKAAKKKRRREPFDPLSVPIPDPLRTLAFLEEWRVFVDYRKRLGKPFKTENGPEGAFKHLLPLGPQRAVQALKITREKEWQGVEHGVAELERREREAAAAPGSPAGETKRSAARLEVRKRDLRATAFSNRKLTAEQRDSIVEAIDRATCDEDLERILWPLS